jgi:hypothetical protein
LWFWYTLFIFQSWEEGKQQMTIEEKVKDMLVEHGLWDNEAVIVVEKAKEAPNLVSMIEGHDRWADDVSGYPTGLLATVFVSVKYIAIDWLKAEKPMHFALPMLEGSLVPQS